MSFSRKRRDNLNEQTSDGNDKLFFVFDREGGDFSQKNNRSEKRLKLSNDDDLDPALKEDLHYIRTALERVDGKFDSDEDKEIFVSNVLKEVIEKFVLLSCTKSGSNILERLLPLATVNDLLPIIEAYGSDKRKMCIHQLASHVTETLIKRVFKLIVEHEEKITKIENKEEEFKTLTDWAKSFCTFIFNNFEVFLTETYACHIVRVLLEESSNSRQFDPLTKKFVKKVIHLENCSELLAQSQTIKLFCSFIEIFKKLEYKLDTVVRFLTKEIATFKSGSDKDSLPFLVTDKNTSVLMDSIIENSSSEVFDYLLQFLKNHIANLARHSIANFVLQKLLKSCKTAEQVECLFDELNDIFDDILECGYFGVLTNLAKACIQHKTRQKEYIKALSSAVGCQDEKLFFPSVATLCHQDHLTSILNVKFQGSLIVQQLLLFDEPKQICESMLNFDTSAMINLACQKFGSHIIDSCFKSQTVAKDVKTKIVDRLQDHFTDLACDKFGSRTLDNIWHSSSIETRIKIAEELLNNMAKLRKSFFGAKLINNYNLTEFRRTPDKWKHLQTTKNVKKVKNFFQ